MAVPSVTLPRPRRRWAVGERLSAIPWRNEALLVAGVVVLAAVYQYLQAHRRATPWIFPDENRYAAFARAVAETGRNSLHGEHPITGSLQSYLLALPWRIGDVSTAWQLEKAITVTAFCLAAIPVYLFARRLASQWAALLAAAASVLLPAAFYSATLMQEPFAYPVVLTAALLTARLIERFSWRIVIGLAIVSIIGVLLRGQLAIVPLAAAIALLADAAAQAIRGRRPDRRAILVGVVALVGGALLFRQTYGFVLLKDGWRGLVDHPGTFFRVMSHSSATTVIAVAVVPAVALLACLVWLGSAERSEE